MFNSANSRRNALDDVDRLVVPAPADSTARHCGRRRVRRGGGPLVRAAPAQAPPASLARRDRPRRCGRPVLVAQAAGGRRRLGRLGAGRTRCTRRADAGRARADRSRTCAGSRADARAPRRIRRISSPRERRRPVRPAVARSAATERSGSASRTNRRLTRAERGPLRPVPLGARRDRGGCSRAEPIPRTWLRRARRSARSTARRAGRPRSSSRRARMRGSAMSARRSSTRTTRW